MAYDQNGNAVQLRTYADQLDKQMSILLDLIPREIVDAFPLPLSIKNQQDGGSKSKKHDQQSKTDKTQDKGKKRGRPKAPLGSKQNEQAKEDA